jgi:hypothetical protein
MAIVTDVLFVGVVFGLCADVCGGVVEFVSAGNGAGFVLADGCHVLSAIVVVGIFVSGGKCSKTR